MIGTHQGGRLSWNGGLRLLSLLLLALSAGLLGATRAQAATGKVTVCATVETDPVAHPGDAAEDEAIWLNPTDRSKSTVIGVDKLTGGGLTVYDLAGHTLYSYPDDRLNAVDIRYNVPLGSGRVTLVAAANRSHARVDFWKVNERDGSLTSIGSMPTSKAIVTPLGLALYHSPVSGSYYAFVTDNGHTDQYELDGSSGQMTGSLVRQLVLQNPTEGLVADDYYARVYVSEEGVGGITRYGAEPGDPITGSRIDTTTDNTKTPGHIVPNARGLAIYQGSAGAGYIVLASEGGNSFDVYDRSSNAWKGEFGIGDCPQNGTDRVTATDGVDVTNASLGSAFPDGMLTAQDTSNTGADQNYKYVPWKSIATALGLVVDTSFDPRSVGDAIAPGTSITVGPPASTTATSATFAFSSSDGDVTGFECAVDAGTFTPCVSPKTYNALAVGSHSFAVRAHDGAGNVDPTPASRPWIVIGSLTSQGGTHDASQASAPLGLTPTTLQGSAKAGAVLTCVPGTFSGSPAPTLAIVWLRSGVLIQGAAGISYVLGTGDAGSSLVCRVTASNGIGSSSATSNVVAVPTSSVAVASIAIISRTLAPRDRLELRIACPAQSTAVCSGSLTLATAKAITLGKGARRKVVVLGRARFHVRPGQHLTSRVVLSSAASSLVRRLGTLAVRLTSVRGAQAGVSVASLQSRTFTLRRRRS